MHFCLEEEFPVDGEFSVETLELVAIRNPTATRKLVSILYNTSFRSY